MAVTINASTSAGLVNTADTSGVLALQTAGTTAVTVDASQNTTFAGTATATKLIPTGTSVTGNGMYLPAANSVGISTNGTNAVYIDSSQNVGVGVAPSAWQTSAGSRAIQFTGSSVYGYRDTNLILTQNAYFDGAYKYYASSIAAGYYTIGSGTHTWYNAPSGTAGNAITFTQAMTLNANGVLALQGASTSATGVGITFPATESASTDVNTLDDYEEGTWTPTITPLAGSLTSYTSSGRYTKIGRVVNLDFLVSILTVGTASSVMVIANLPFNTAGLNQGAGVMRENQTIGSNGALVVTNSTTLYGAQYNGGSPFVVNYTWVCQITYAT